MSKELQERFSALENPPENADSNWYQRRGKELEKIIFELLQSEGLKPRTNYRPQGEEIDGSFMLDGKYFLLEAKWHSNKLPASTVYQFKGKIDGKLIGTIGIFISMSGYNEDTVEAIRFGKTLNVILFDGDDFKVCVQERKSFTDILRVKLRRAAETGEIYFPYKSEEILEGSLSDILFVVEGYTDQHIISKVASKVLERQHMNRNIDFIVAMGKTGVANIANSIMFSPSKNTKVIFVVDSDGDFKGTKSLLDNRIEYSEENVLIMHPTIEALFFPTDEAYAKYLRASPANAREILGNQLANLDLDKLKATNETFRRFVNLLIE